MQERDPSFETSNRSNAKTGKVRFRCLIFVAATTQAHPNGSTTITTTNCGTLRFRTINVTLFCPVLCDSCLYARNSSSTDGSNPASTGLPPDEDAATATMATIIGGTVAGFAVLAALIWFALHMQKGKQDAHPQDEEGRPNVNAANRAHFDNPTFSRGGNLERASTAQQNEGAAETVYVEADPNQPAEYDEAKRLAAVYAEVQDPPTVVCAEVIDPNVTYTPLADGKATYAAANSGHAANSEA